MKIISLNAWKGELRDRLRDFIESEANNTDIFCFQEMTAADAESTCLDILQPEFDHVCSAKRTDHGGFEQITFFRRTIKLISKQSLFEKVDNYGGALITQFEVGCRTFFVCNTNGLPLPGDKLDTKERLEQSTKIIDYLADKPGQKIIIGDFNLMPGTESIKIFEKVGYRNLIREYGITNTRNHYIWDLYPDTPQYYSDYAFVSPDVKVTNFEVLPEEVSDHQPLLLTIE